MTPDQLTLVQTTYRQVAPHAAELSADFYRRLFDVAPGLRALFPDDLAAQQRKFTDELTAIVEAVTDLPRLLERTQPLGARHADYGARASHYRVVGEVLLAALAHQLGDAFTDDVSEAWSSAYHLVAEAMLSGTSVASGDVGRR